MNTDSAVHSFAQSLGPLLQWALLTPIWLVCLGGIVAAAVFWRACPRSAALTLAAIGLLVFATAAQPLVNHVLVLARARKGWTAAELGFRIMGAGALLNLIRAAAYTMLLTAVFLGRHPVNTLPAASAGPLPPPLPASL